MGVLGPGGHEKVEEVQTKPFQDVGLNSGPRRGVGKDRRSTSSTLKSIRRFLRETGSIYRNEPLINDSRKEICH